MSNIFERKDWRTLADYPNFEINTDGKVRKIETGKYLKLVSDRLGRPIAVFHSPVGATCEYISDLLAATFGPEANQVAVVKDEKYTEIMPEPEVVVARKRKHIRCKTTGEEFKSIAACARKFNFNYDKFYDTFKATGQYQGLEFEEF